MTRTAVPLASESDSESGLRVLKNSFHSESESRWKRDTSRFKAAASDRSGYDNTHHVIHEA